MMLKKTESLRLNKLLSLGLACFVAATASAQVLEEITVTAQKREQSLQDVGIAVTALSSENIREYNLSSAIDIVSRVPSMDNYGPYGPGSSANITIRGVGLNDFGEGHEAPVTTYVDQFYIVSVPAVDFALYDLDRIEVLRGPQGTLFGRNSTGGLINYVTKRPTQEMSGYLSAESASFGEVKGEGAMSGSLSDNISGRVSFLYHDSDGYIKNLNPDLGNGGQAGTKAVRGQLMYVPSDDFSVWLKAEYADISKNHNYYEQIPAIPDPVTGLYSVDPNGTDGAGYNEANFGAADRNVTYTDKPQRMSQDGTNVLLTIQKDLSEYTFTSATGYMEMDRKLVEDCDASPNDICFADFPYSTDWFTQEFRLNGDTDQMRWTAGVFYMQQDAKDQPSAYFNVPVSGPGATDPETGLYNGDIFPISLAADWKQETTSYSVFGQTEYDFTDVLTGIVGARFTHDNKDFRDADNATLRTCPDFPIPTNCFVPPEGTGIPNPYSNSYSGDLWSWKVGLNYMPTNDLLLFTSISQGTKSGGANNGFYSSAAVDRSLIPYGDETNIAYEVGVKSNWWDNRFRINATAFYYDYSDYQTFNWEGIGGLVGNSDASAYGGEVEIEAFLTDAIYVQLAGSYLDTEIQDVVGRAETYIANREMASAPEYTANGTVSYAFNLANNVETKLIWNWNYKSERYTNNFDDPASELESFFKHNASVVVNWDKHWELTGYVNNIADKENANRTFVFSDLGYLQVAYAQPRTYGGRITYSW